MMNATTRTNATKTTTLEKWWTSKTNEEEDIIMEDKNEREEENNEQQKNDICQNNYRELFPMTLRMKIESDSKADANKKHVEVLQSLAIYFKHCEIYTTKGVKTNLKPDNSDDFDYHEVRTKRKHFHIVVHRVVLSAKYHHIKKERAIIDTLKRNKCQLQLHEWHSSQWDVINVGFLSGSSPKHQSKDTLKHKLSTIDPKQPKFELHATTLNIESNGQNYQVLAYEIQCLRNEYNEVTEYIAKTCKVIDQTFIKYQWKYTNKTTYDNGIKKQIAFVDSIRTIPVYGIHPIAMEIMFKDLVNDHDIIDINSTGKTTSHGRWNIYVTAENFETQTKWFQNNIAETYNKMCQHVKKEIPTDYSPEIKFNTTVSFHPKPTDHILEDAEKSVGSFTNTSIDSRSWASVVSGPKTRTSQTISTITSTNNLTLQMSQLTSRIDEIFHRLDNLEKRMDKQDEIIQQMQHFERSCESHLQRLSDLIEKLEERTATIAPRRLELTFDQTEPNKKRNTNSTPTKQRHHT